MNESNWLKTVMRVCVWKPHFRNTLIQENVSYVSLFSEWSSVPFYFVRNFK